MNIELERISAEAQNLHERFLNDRGELSKRRSELFKEFKSQVATWELTRPHSDDLERAFLAQRKAIVAINDEFNDWTRRYNEAQKQVVRQLTPSSESDDETRLSDVRKLLELIRKLEPELPRLKKIVNRLENTVRVISSFNPAPQ